MALEVELEKKKLEYTNEDGQKVRVDIDQDLTEKEEEAFKSNHYANLAEELPNQEVIKIGKELIKQYEDDKSSRKDWEDQYSKGLKMLGVVVEDRQDPFPGASGVHHPLMSEAATQFQARAIAEMFPSGGPVKTQIIGKQTDKKIEQAQRVQDFMNYQVTNQIPDYFNELDQMLFYLALAGSAFKKIFFDNSLDRICSKFVPADQFVISYENTDLETAERYTQVMKLTVNEIKKKQIEGFYRDVPITKNQGGNDSQDVVEQTIQRLEGMSSSMSDNIHTILEIHADLDLGEDDSGLALPYIVTVDYETGQTLAIRRNWKEDDPLKRKRTYFIHYKYLPGLGFYGFGLIQMIGGLQHASTGALRALLDSAAFANLNGGFKAKGARIEGGDLTIAPGEWVDVEAYGDDLRKSFIPLPFKEPSPTLLQLLGVLSESGRRFASIADAMVGDSAGSGPVGTTIALIEQGSKVFSAIHKRLHQAQGREFKLIYELNGEYLDDEYPYDVIGERKIIRRKDFNDAVNVVPVSDPNIFSQAQRIALAQTGLQLAQQAPSIIDTKEAYRRFLQSLNIPDYQDLIIEDEDVPRRDPVSENMALLNGKPIKVFEDQDHQAHIAVHQQFINDPRFGGNPQAKEVLYPLMMAHLGQHMAYLYQQQMQAQVPEGMITSSGEMNKELRDEEPKELDIEQENRIAAAAAQAAQSLMGSMPPSPEQQQQQMQMAEKQANLQLKQEELSIRKARFAEGVKDKERVNARKDAETKARIIETASRVAKRD
mgnify:FL=1|jgi:hypothetical protein|tara:strand:+ start:312 stop:2618 length:2307 start_codon:yes stop_codon:yes gene_type:complete